MKKSLIFALLLMLMITFFSAAEARAQNRKSVSAAEANGTFRLQFGGKFKDTYNEIKILALGKGKLRVSFNLLYPYLLAGGERTANIGDAEGEAIITGDTAIFSSDEFGNCKISIKFVKPGLIRVTQEGIDADCGFGHNVTANGSYKKVSGAKPKF